MSVLVSLDNVSKAHGTTVILEEVSLGVADGDAIGVVGRNGGGKTTLVSIMAGLEDVDAGRITQSGGLRVGVLTQTDDLDPDATVQEAIVGIDTAEHLWQGDAAIRSVLSGLEVVPLLQRRVSTLSGGERRRTALAALLCTDLDLLILDEPTNHLDVEGVGWLAGHLAGAAGTPGSRHRALVMVTHDRWFLDEVSMVTWEVGDGQVRSYEGGYSAYVLARAERTRQAAASESRRMNLLRKELAWLRRGAPARTSKPRYRVEAANELIASEPPPRDSTTLQRFASTRLGRQVYDLEDAYLSFGDRVILSDVTWRPGPGDRIGLIGVNGAGKSTILRVLTGTQQLDAGTIRVGQTVSVAYLSQDVTELPDTVRVLEAVDQIAHVLRIGDEDVSAGQLLERFGFKAARQWTPVGDLSGGERRRLQLLRLLMSGPNVLVLDEPTNDLDVDTLTALEDLLDSWAGTLIVVSHDRWFLERVCDTVAALMGDGTLAALPGGVTQYLQSRRSRQAPAEVTASSASAGAGGGGGGGGNSRLDPRAARKELSKIERSLKAADRREVELHATLAEHASDHVRVRQLDAELTEVTAQRGRLEESWLELSEAVDPG